MLDHKSLRIIMPALRRTSHTISRDGQADCPHLEGETDQALALHGSYAPPNHGKRLLRVVDAVGGLNRNLGSQALAAL